MKQSNTQQAQPLRLTKYNDAGHGWLCVEESTLRAAGLTRARLSSWSRVDTRNRLVYLEEDLDMPIALFHLLSESLGRQIVITIEEEAHFVRQLPRNTGGKAHPDTIRAVSEFFKKRRDAGRLVFTSD